MRVRQLMLAVCVLAAGVQEAASAVPEHEVAFSGFVRHPFEADVVHVDTADLTGDGLTDVVVTTGYGESPDAFSLFLLRQLSDGSLSPPEHFPFSGDYGGEMDVDIGDLDEDGLEDVVVSTGQGLDIFFQSPEGGLEDAVFIDGPSTGRVEVLDMDGDDIQDLAISDADGVAILRNQLNGVFEEVRISEEYGDFEAVGDVSGDGRPDIVGREHAYEGDLVVHLQSADGSFSDPVFYPGVGSGYEAAIGDVSGDGLPDVIASEYANRPRAALNIYRQQPTGTLGDVEHRPVYEIPDVVKIADVNEDGRDDVVVGHNAWGEIGVILQGVDGSLGTEELFPGPHYSDDIAIADVDNDGLQDLLVAGSGEGLAVLYQTTTEISLSSSDPRVDIGETITLSGALSFLDSSPAAGQTIHLLRDGSEIATRTTSADGTFAFSDAPGPAGLHVYQALWHSDGGHTDGFSVEVWVRVDKIPAVISTTWQSPAKVGEPIEVAGRLALPAGGSAGGHLLKLMRRKKFSSEEVAGTVESDIEGAFALSDDHDGVGEFFYWVEWGGDENHSETHSDSINVARKYGTSLTLADPQDSIWQGREINLSGVLSFDGPTGPEGKSVMLYRGKDAAALEPVATASVDAGGTWSLVDVPPEAGRYRYEARWAGDQDHLAAVSPEAFTDVWFAGSTPLSLALTAQPTWVRPGERARVKAHLEAPPGPPRSIRIYQVMQDGSHLKIGEGVPDANGDLISLSTPLDGRATFEAEASVKGEAVLPEPTLEVGVMPNLSLKARSPDRIRGRYRIYVDRPPRLRARLLLAHSRTVILYVQRKKPSGWQHVRAIKLISGPDGKVTTRVRRLKEGARYRVRAVFVGDADHLPARSAWVYVRRV